MQRFHSKYSKETLVGQAIYFMLDPDENVRPDFITLEKQLPNLQEVENVLLRGQSLQDSVAF